MQDWPLTVDRVLEHGRKVFEQVMKAPVPGRDELGARYDSARWASAPSCTL